MKNRKNIVRLVSLIFPFLAVVMRCSMNELAGTGTETSTNARITGTVIDSAGKPVAGATVTLRPSDYAALPNNVSGFDTLSQKETATNASGIYSFMSVRVGSYALEMSDEQGQGGLARCTIPDDYTNVVIDKKTLRRQGILRGVIPPEQRAGKEWFVQILGLERFTAADPNSGAFVFNDIPEGDYTVRQITMKSDSNPVLIENIHLPAGTVVTVPYAAWKYSKRLFLNTTSTGADIAANLYDFPILVRPRENNFNFSQANVNGLDLRFSKSDGTPLPFEIERWNSVTQYAEIWVKVDTIFGNDSTQSIIMYYGNPAAPSASNGAVVFETANGFQGVWHLGEAYGSNAADATGNGYDGVPSPSDPTVTQGRIGLGKKFTGEEQYLTMPNTANSKINFPENGVYSISAWVSADSPATPRTGILSKGSTQYTIEIQNTNRWAFTEFKNLTGWQVARSMQPIDFSVPKPATWWVLVTGVRSGDRQYLYINDELCTDTANHIIASVKSRLSNFDLSIGRIEDTDTTTPCYYSGEIDEVRISSVALSKDWISLCYRNQGSDSRLITFK